MREHRHCLRVLYGDTDMMGVVYYAQYFRYFEAGRNELLRASGLEYKAFEALGLLLPVTDARAKYLAPARYDDVIAVTTRVEQLRFGSLRIGYEIEREDDGVTLVTGETTHACVDRDGKVRRLPDALKQALDTTEAAS